MRQRREEKARPGKAAAFRTSARVLLTVFLGLVFAFAAVLFSPPGFLPGDTAGWVGAVAGMTALAAASEPLDAPEPAADTAADAVAGRAAGGVAEAAPAAEVLEPAHEPETPAPGAPNLQVDFPFYPDFRFPEYVYQTNRTKIMVSGRTDPGAAVTVNGVALGVGPDGRFAGEVPLEVEGRTFLRVQATGPTGDWTALIVPVVRDTTPPRLQIAMPPQGWATAAEKAELSGEVEAGARLAVDEQPVTVGPDGRFAVMRNLQPGENRFVFVATDIAGNVTRQEVLVIQDREPPPVRVLEPSPGLITNQSQVTVAGETEAGARVTVDGRPASVDEQGRFEAVVSLEKDGRRDIVVVAEDAAGNRTEVTIRVTRDTRPPTIFPQEPAAPLWLLPGDTLIVRFRGEAGASASFDLGDLRIGLPAAEGNPGNYTGIYRIQPEDRFENVPIRLRLRDQAGNEGTRITQTVSVLDPLVPQVVQVTASDYAVLRTGPGTDYERLTNVYMPTRMEVRGKAGEWYKVQLGSAQTAWVHESTVRVLPPGSLPPRAVISQIRTNPRPDGSSQVAITLSEPVPFLVYPDVRRRALRVTLFNAVYGLYHMAYGPGEKLVRLMTLSQPAADTSELVIDLEAPYVSGYYTRYAGNTLFVELRPPLPKSLAGLRITLDPGHGADPGAVGPTGLREATVNLEIALKLEALLQAAGAQVIMTHRTESAVAAGTDDLYARVEVADLSKSQLFISIHNNALAGAAGLTAEGTETYYYNPLSGQLARLVQQEMVKALGSTDRFFAYRSFAVIRQTGMPAILVEGNFISNAEIERWMREGDFTDRMARAIYQGIVRFLDEVGVGPAAATEEEPEPKEAGPEVLPGATGTEETMAASPPGPGS